MAIQPTLEQLVQFLSGKADDETRRRIAGELFDPKSALRVFVEGVRFRAEGITGWPETWEGDPAVLVEIQEAARARSVISTMRCCVYVLEHAVFWTFWAFFAAHGAYALWQSVAAAMWAGPGLCGMALAVDIIWVTWRRRPPPGTLWEAVAGGLAAWPMFLAHAVLQVAIKWLPDVGPILNAVDSWTLLAFLVTVFCGSATGLFDGFGLRARMHAGKITVFGVVLQWGYLTISYVGFAGFLAQAAWFLGEREAVPLLVVGGAIWAACVAMIASLEHDAMRATPVQAAVALLSGIVFGMPVGVYLGHLDQGASATAWSLLVWAAAFGGFLGSASCGWAVWSGFATWKREFAGLLRLYVSGILSLTAVQYIGFPLQDLLEKLAVIPPSDTISAVVVLGGLAGGVYLGMSGKWLLLVPAGIKKRVHDQWQRMAEMPAMAETITPSAALRAIVGTPLRQTWRSLGSTIDLLIDMVQGLRTDLGWEAR